jgi:Domain of unknown function (DUF6458)
MIRQRDTDAPVDPPHSPGQPGRGPAGRGRVMSTGLALFLIAAGAILRFAVTDGSLRDLNLHTVGVILMVIGVLGLVLRMTTARPSKR